MRDQIQIPTLDEPTAPADLDWGEVRSACAAKDWRRAWEVVGTDHEGEATPGEVYIFGNAQRQSAVSAALRHWYLESLSLSGFGGCDKTWKGRYARIKTIAAWESSAAAQHVKRPPKRLPTWYDLPRAERTEVSIGGVPGLLPNPFIPRSTSSDMADALALSMARASNFRAQVNGATITLTPNPAPRRRPRRRRR